MTKHRLFVDAPELSSTVAFFRLLLGAFEESPCRDARTGRNGVTLKAEALARTEVEMTVLPAGKTMPRYRKPLSIEVGSADAFQRLLARAESTGGQVRNGPGIFAQRGVGEAFKGRVTYRRFFVRAPDGLEVEVRWRLPRAAGDASSQRQRRALPVGHASQAATLP